ncbi:MAG: hypothetical protein GYA12_11630, partial [Chloroflexi bacterium]|nr:hypothetical protein [Chloroflexota bacterium]
HHNKTGHHESAFNAPRSAGKTVRPFESHLANLTLIPDFPLRGGRGDCAAPVMYGIRRVPLTAPSWTNPSKPDRTSRERGQRTTVCREDRSSI